MFYWSSGICFFYENSNKNTCFIFAFLNYCIVRTDLYRDLDWVKCISLWVAKSIESFILVWLSDVRFLSLADWNKCDWTNCYLKFWISFDFFLNMMKDNDMETCLALLIEFSKSVAHFFLAMVHLFDYVFSNSISIRCRSNIQKYLREMSNRPWRIWVCCRILKNRDYILFIIRLAF